MGSDAKFRELTISRLDPSSRTVALQVEGEVDLAVVERLDNAIQSAGEDKDLVALELSRCDFIDSSAIHTILQHRRALGSAGKRLVLCGPKRQTRRVLEATGLTDDGFVVADLDEALQPHSRS